MSRKTPEQVVGEVIGRTIGSIGYYFLLRRTGAPKYIAFNEGKNVASLERRRSAKRCCRTYRKL